MVSPPFNRSLSALFMLLVLVVVGIGCGKNSNPSPPATLTTVEGNWKVNSIKLNGTLDVTSSLTAYVWDLHHRHYTLV